VETEAAIYLGLFWNAFIAATLLPALSELTLAGLLDAGIGLPLWLFIAATSGNVAGSTLNWWLGRSLAHFEGKRWFPFSRHQIAKAGQQFQRFGQWSLLFAWMPIVGDPLTLVAGTLRTPFPVFLVLVTIGKAARYAVIIVSFSCFSS